MIAGLDPRALVNRQYRDSIESGSITPEELQTMAENAAQAGWRSGLSEGRRAGVRVGIVIGWTLGWWAAFILQWLLT